MQAGKRIFLIFLAAGVAMLGCAGWSVWRTRQFLATSVAADGEVIENVWSPDTSSSSNSGTYHPRVRFQTGNGQELVFLSKSGSQPASFAVGERVQVLYDPEDYSNASINSFMSLWFVSVIFGGLGVVFCLVGGIPFALQNRSRQKDDWLRANGRRILADFTRVELNTGLEVNGNNPYRIVCQWLDPATNQVHLFHSHNIWYDPQKYISGTSMMVLVDPNNLRRYVVETDFLPKLAE